jgi:putative ABC transport system permease protein
METFLSDLAFGVRTLRKSPGFAITTLVTLALGIGATTAIFSVVNAVLLRPLPYPDADRLVLITSDLRTRSVRDFPFAPADLKDLRDQTTAFNGIEGVVTFRQSVASMTGEPEQVTVAFATKDFLPLLGERMLLGRGFNDDDATPPPPPPKTPLAANAPPPPPQNVAVILGHDYWQRRYGGDRSVIGKVIDMGGNRGYVVGVAAPELELLFPPRMAITRVPDLFMVSRIDLSTASRINVVFRLVARLKDGTSLPVAQHQVDAVASDLRKRFPIDSTAGVYFRVEPMRADLVADVKPALLMLLGAVTFVLLIACANVANLILVRTSRRERELAVRAAFGGSRARLVRQMLAEALVLSTGGALFGLIVATLGIRLLAAIGPQNLPNIQHVGLDAGVLAFTMIAALGSAAVFGVVPALRASRPDLIGVLRQSGRTEGLAAGHLLRNGVVMAEVTLAFVLLVGGGLMFRSFLALVNTDPGFDPRGVMTFVANDNRQMNQEQRSAYMRAQHDRLAAVPGVTQVTVAFPLPLDGNINNLRWGTAAAIADPSTFKQGNVFIVIPGYFETLHTPILAGRDFTEAENTPKSQAVIIDELVAAKAFPGETAVGKRLLVRFRADTAEWMDVIGVVRHQRHETLAAAGREALYVTDGQLGFGNANRWALRTKGDPAALMPAARKTLAELDPGIAVSEVLPMAGYVTKARESTTFALALIGAFAVIAVVLSGVGLYGVLSTTVRQRTAEIGVRMALGAPKMGIFAMVIGQGVKMSVAGIVVGLIASLAVTRVMRSLLVGVAPTDPLTFGAVAALFFGIAVFACWLPARRAAGMDPAIALRDD